MAGNLAGLGMNFVDTIMAGRIGAVALGAISIGGAIWSAVFLFVVGVLMALPPAVAHLDGAERPSEAGLISRQAAWLAMALGILLWLVCRNALPVLQAIGVDADISSVAGEYLLALSWGAPAISWILVLRFFSEGTGHTRPTMYFGLLGVALNIPANYIFIHGGLGLPAMGAIGVGWATTLVYWLQLFVWLMWISKRPAYRSFKLFSRFDWPQREQISELIRVGFPIGGMVAVEGSLFVTAALLIGRLGQIPVAAHQIAINFASLAFMIPLGLGGAISVRVGNALGRDDPVSARYQGFLGLGLALLLETMAATFMFLFPREIVALYTHDTQVTHLAIQLLFLAAIFQWSDGLQVTAAGALRGCKDTRIPMVYSIIAYWLVGMTLGYYLTFNYGLGARGMWVGMIGGLSAAAILLVTRFYRTSTRLIQAAQLEQEPGSP